MLRLEAAARPRQIRKPHSPAHADRGFLHGWLSYAKQRPKPFSIQDIRAAFAFARYLPLLRRPSDVVLGVEGGPSASEQYV